MSTDPNLFPNHTYFKTVLLEYTKRYPAMETMFVQAKSFLSSENNPKSEPLFSIHDYNALTTNWALFSCSWISLSCRMLKGLQVYLYELFRLLPNKQAVK